MADWTGSTAKRRDRTKAGIYPNPPPTPSRREYIIELGTSALVKRVGDKEWKPFTTRKRCVFDDLYRETIRSFIFFANGWLLCVHKGSVERR